MGRWRRHSLDEVALLLFKYTSAPAVLSCYIQHTDGLVCVLIRPLLSLLLCQKSPLHVQAKTTGAAEVIGVCVCVRGCVRVCLLYLEQQ